MLGNALDIDDENDDGNDYGQNILPGCTVPVHVLHVVLVPVPVTVRARPLKI